MANFRMGRSHSGLAKPHNHWAIAVPCLAGCKTLRGWRACSRGNIKSFVSRLSRSLYEWISSISKNKHRVLEPRSSDRQTHTRRLTKKSRINTIEQSISPSAFFSQTNKGNQQRPGSTTDKGYAPWTLDKDEPL